MPDIILTFLESQPTLLLTIINLISRGQDAFNDTIALISVAFGLFNYIY